MSLTGDAALRALCERPGTAELVADGVRTDRDALHDGARAWARAWRAAGISRGDRVVVALPNGAALAQLVIASLMDGVTLVPVPAGEACAPLLEQLDARIAVATSADVADVVRPSASGGPPAAPLRPRPRSAPTDGIAFLLRTSGTGGAPRWIGLSGAGVHAVLASHMPRLAVDGGSVLSVLPWHHAFGLVLDLLPALLRADRIVASSARVRSAAEIVHAAEAHAVTHLSMVPLTVMRLAATTGGLALLRAIKGGLVGGAPIDPSLVPVLRTTRLRVGYGQTEASPGIMMGEPGEFRPFILGRPLGCDVRIDADSVLAFHGPNACAGVWQDGAFHALPADRWQRTDDRVAMEDDVYVFRGRASMTFKLANGTPVEAPQLEQAIRLRFPQVTGVVVTTADGTSIDVVYSTSDGTPVDTAAILDVTGRLRRWIGDIRVVRASRWDRTAKGDIDRRRIPT